MGGILERIPAIFKNRLFLSVLALKLLFSLLFGSDYIVKWFVPFVNYFVLSGFSNPYDFFASAGILKAFPYSAMMLFVLAIPRVLFSPFLSAGWQDVGALNLLAIRLPLLIADITILYILCLWLKGKEKSVLLLYWCSPITFYISYFHGQLDAIPVAILMIALYFLFERKFGLSSLSFGAAIAAKATVIAAIPFILVFLWKNERSHKAIFSYLMVSAAVFALLISPFALSDGYKKIVLGSDEQAKAFSFSFDYGYLGINLFVAPAVIVAILFVFSSFTRLNRDILLMVLCLVFISFVAFVPPMPGWYYWSVPFLAFFFVKEEKAPLWGYCALSILYIAYFTLRADSDIFNSFQVIAPQIASIPTPFESLSRIGANASFISNILFTAFTSLVLATAFWVYRIGIKSNLEYRTRSRPLMIGICGDSSAGKNYLAELLCGLFGGENSIVVNGDDMHRWERADQKWEIFTHLNPKSNRLHLDMQQAVSLKNGREVYRAEYDHASGKFTPKRKVSPNKFIIFTGLHLFFLGRMRRIFDIRVFMQPEEELRKKWKLERDTAKRGHAKERVMREIERRKPDFEKFVLPQKKFSDIAVSYCTDGSLKMRVRNDVDVDAFFGHLSAVPSLKSDYFSEDDFVHNCLEFSGRISQSDVASIAYKMVPNLEELILYTPSWCEGNDGLVQLFFAYYISEKLREKSLLARDWNV